MSRAPCSAVIARGTAFGPRQDDSHVAGAGLGDYGGDLLAEPGRLLYGIDVSL